MKLKKIFGIVVGILPVLLPIAVNAEETIYSLDRESYTCSNIFGEVFAPQNLNYQNEEISLFCEFEEPDEILEEVNDKYEDYLIFLKENYNLPEIISNDNSNTYYESLLALKDTLIDDIEYNELIQFLKIYRYSDINNEIENSINELNNLTSMEDIMSKKNEINLLLPMYSQKLMVITPYKATNGMNVSKAVDYAAKYATSPNDAYDYYPGADCTNFVSQILDNSGVSQIIGLGQNFGWWRACVLGNCVHSYSWTSANAFANYWDVTYATNNFENLSKNIQRGDIVCYDEGDTGEVNHFGFITVTSTTEKTYTKNNGSKVNYYTFKVAQHSGNYNLWVDQADNHWEETTNNQTNYFVYRFH